ncbi:histidine phosphatase family protein [Fertoebacter nigrum]|uniref:Histidine phosphatase family protein n=1 Tax=Fertoeibacter niger TaxID=2656921 RepID=A0A8X8GZF0_9RHOB|nr:histidine phosphatase family protein [Fertoeibacter niger]NUB45957.1 histidine phosphatase family protein [Fertoeibacter niger]
MKRLILVRHGETEWNASRRLQGQTDIALSDVGRAQARALAPMVAALSPDHAVTSDLARAAETARLLGHASARDEPRLREQDLGDWSDQSIADLSARDPDAYLRWRAGRQTPPGGEDWGRFSARVVAGIEDAMRLCDQTVLAVCHGGAIRAALASLIDLRPDRLIPVGPASLTILAADKGGWRLEAFNVGGATVVLTAPD